MDTGRSPEGEKKIRGSAIPYWRSLRTTYPRIAACMALAIAVLFLADLLLVCKGIDYGRELTLLRASLTRAEIQRVDSIEAAESNIMAMTVELARREALGDRELHLVVDSRESLMYLEREGAVLREMRVRMAPEEAVGAKPDIVCLATPRGKRLVVRVVEDTYRWEVPVCAFDQSGKPVPDDRSIPGGLGPLALILDSGSVIYSQPAAGPLSNTNYVLPGSVRAEAADMEAIREDLQAGMAVYFL